MVCASIKFWGGWRNPITDSLPLIVPVRLANQSGAQALLDLFYDETFWEQYGGQAALDRLCEPLLINRLRHCLDRGLTQRGWLAALADARLDKPLMALHQDATRP